jgi:hypothetical protein
MAYLFPSPKREFLSVRNRGGLQTNLPSIVYILLYGNRILVSDGDLPWLNTADSFLLKITYRPIALTTALFFPWAMTPLLRLRGVLFRQHYLVHLNLSCYFPPISSFPIFVHNNVYSFRRPALLLATFSSRLAIAVMDRHTFTDASPFSPFPPSPPS